MRAALILLALCASAWAQPELTRARAMELWPIYVSTQQAPGWPGAVLARLNMYRAACGLAPVTNDARLNPASQQCAVVLASNPAWTISHVLPSTLKGWTKEAAAAATRSCLDRHDDGARGVADMVRDWGLSMENRLVGHRRWLLSPGLQTVGIGTVAGTMNTPASVVIYVMTPQGGARDRVAWPPPGDVPMAWVPERWSWSAAGADVSKAIVLVDDQVYVPVRQNSGTPPSAVIWQPSIPFNVEDVHRVHILGVTVGGVAQEIAYEVRRFRP